MSFFSRFALFQALLPLFLASPGLAVDLHIPVPNPQNVKPADKTATPAQIDVKKRIYQSACPAVLSGHVKATILPPLADGECGERSPLQVSEITGIRLTQEAVLNCRMATTLAEWIQKADEAARMSFGSGLSAIATSTSYQCRRRNNAADGKISEHGFANALDIVGFQLANGMQISVLNDWGETKDSTTADNGSEIVDPNKPSTQTSEGQYLRLVHTQACKQFTTVLGPESNPHHEDHFHLDLGCHGKTCTYRICE